MYGPLIDSVSIYVKIFIETIGSVFTTTEGWMPFLLVHILIGTAFSLVFFVIKLVRKFFF